MDHVRYSHFLTDANWGGTRHLIPGEMAEKREILPGPSRPCTPEQKIKE